MPFGASRLAFLAKVAAEAASGGITYRTDTYASNVYLALPFDETNELNDVSPSINSGSTQATLTSGANSSVTTAEVYWTTPNYGKALENVNANATQSMAYGLSTSVPSSASGTFVIEGWFKADDATSNSNWAISSADSGGRFLFGINTSSATNFGNENNIGLGDTDWHHIAIVCDAGTKRLYIDGKYKQATTGGNTDWYTANTGFSTLHLGQFNAGDNNDFRGHIQDFRVTIGSNRGYTGTNTSTANFTLPQSIVESFAAVVSRGVLNVYGDTQVDTSKKVFGTGSALFDGAGDYIEFIPTNDYSLYTGNFTIECWFLAEADTGQATGTIASNRSGGYGARDYMILYRNYDNKINVPFKAWDPATSTVQDVLGGLSAVVTNNTWNHVAFGYDGSRYSCWLNGTRFDTDTANASGQEIDFENFWIGAQDNGSDPFNAGNGNGQIDEFRVSLVDRYGVNNSSITVPTSAFTNDSDTLLLLHMDGADGSTTFKDDGPRTAVSVTAYGNAQVDTAQSKFGGASALFDGSGDYLDADSLGSIAGSGEDFTIEGYFRWASTSGGQGLMSDRPPTSSGYTTNNFYLEKNSSNTLFFGFSGGGDITGTSSVTTNTWYHIAVVRYSGTTKLYLNGTQTGSTLSYTGAVGDGDISIGAVVGQYMNGHIDEVRISDTARYTANFTTPTSAFTNDANTKLLLHMDGADASTTFTDDTTSAAVSGRTAKTVTASGDAQVSTAQSKFGTGSLYSDGTTDYLSVTADSDFVFGSNDFTLEAWVRPANTGVGSGDQIISKWSGSNGYSFGLTYGTTSPKNNIRALINDTGGIRGFQVISNPLTVDAWNHVALVVESGTLALYANGNRIGTTSVTAFNDATNADVTISALSGGSYSPNHYQDEVRISDTARYSGSTYTVPTAAFTNDANTLLLLHCDGTNGSTTFTDDNS